MSMEMTARDAEQALLGAMMLSPTEMWRAFDIVTPADFQDVKHETIARVIGDLAHAGERVDTLTVSDALLSRGLAQQVPIESIYEMTAKVTTASMASYYAEIVKRHAGLRRAAKASVLLGQGVAEGRDLEGLVDEARALLDAAVDTRSDIQTVGAYFNELDEELRRPPKYYPTCWPDLNRYVNGLMPGAVYVVAARPGSGKTIALMQMAKSMAEHGSVVVSSLEMPRAQLLRRLVASDASVSLGVLSRHSLSEEDWARIAPARERIQQMPLYIDDRSSVTIAQIESYVRQVARKGPIAGLVVDYLQLIPTRDTRKSRWEHIGELTRAFKILAKDLGIVVVLASQLNRESEKDQRLPTLADLRESGSIEQDADVVLMLRRRQDKDRNPLDELDMVIAKNRHGQQGRIELAWEGRYARLAPMAFGSAAADWRAMQAGAN